MRTLSVATWRSPDPARARTSHKAVLLASPPSCLRRSAVDLLQRHAYDVHVAGDVDALLEGVAALRPRVIVLDGALAGDPPFDLPARLCAHPAAWRVPVLMYAPDPTPAFCEAARRAGAMALEDFPADSHDLVRTLDYLLAGLPPVDMRVRVTVAGDFRPVVYEVGGVRDARVVQVVAAGPEAPRPGDHLYRHAELRFEYLEDDHTDVAWRGSVVRAGSLTADIRLTGLVSRQPRRQAVRKDVPLELEVVDPDGIRTPARAVNLSVAGMLVADMAFVPRVGAVFDYRLHLGHTLLTVRGAVRRTQSLPKLGHSVGVAFVGMQPAARDQLIDFLFCLRSA